jgi:hypothetical protein
MVLYAGFRLSGYQTLRNCLAWNQSLLGLPVNQRGQGLPDDASNIPSGLIHSHLLDEVTPSGSELIAFTPLLLTRACQAHARGCRSPPTTWAVGFDDLCLRRDHLTNIGPQLQQSSHRCRSSPVLKDGFERTNRTTRLEPTHLAVSFLPIDGVPVYRFVGGCTSNFVCLCSRVCRHLLFLHCRFAKFSRDERPDGSRPAFAEGDVVSWLNPYSPHYRATFAFSILPDPQPHRPTLRLAFPVARGSFGFTTFRVSTGPGGLGSAFSPRALRLR